MYTHDILLDAGRTETTLTVTPTKELCKLEMKITVPYFFPIGLQQKFK